VTRNLSMPSPARLGSSEETPARDGTHPGPAVRAAIAIVRARLALRGSHQLIQAYRDIASAGVVTLTADNTGDVRVMLEAAFEVRGYEHAKPATSTGFAKGLPPRPPPSA
jgi:hypothetical protein